MASEGGSSGNCGPIADALVILNGMTASASTCTFTTAMLSDGNCRFDLSATCGAISETGYTVQETQGGSLIDGKLTLSTSSCLVPTT